MPNRNEPNTTATPLDATLPLPSGDAPLAGQAEPKASDPTWRAHALALPEPISTAVDLHFCQLKPLAEISSVLGLLPRDAARLLIDGARMVLAACAGGPPAPAIGDPQCTIGAQRCDPAAERLAQILMDRPLDRVDLASVKEALPGNLQADCEPYFQLATLAQCHVPQFAETLVASPPTPAQDVMPGPSHASDVQAETTLPLPGGPTPGGGLPTPPASRQAPLASFGDYELLSVIARGGMGVVYKARQKKLNRIVAVKMILSGQFADQQEIDRFYVEAEAAAKLRHPNIVAVHEIGEWQGQHFFSMDYIDGKSLGDLVRDQPLPPRQAADYVRRVAETVQFAHEQGILHRDLKPSNVLVDRRGEPYVTDFGLAKQMSGQSQLTVSGAIVGTPSYMPPEQASGRADQVGPHSDIYSLGAILYELLTGRPPFRAATPFETIRQVLQNEPVSPRLINSSVPKDLETICLKCLQKEPSRRYASAAELAEELQCYLDGRPIKARPVSTAERVWRWCRRNPWLASAIATAAVFLVMAFLGLVTAYAYRGWALRESEASFREALRVINQFTTRVSEETLLNQPGMQPLRRDLLELALAHYQNMLRRRQSDRLLRDELAGTYFRIGIITSLLESPAKAIPHYQQAVAIHRDLLSRIPQNPTHIAGLAETLNAMGTAYYSMGQLNEALKQFQEARNLRVQLTQLQPDNIEYRRVLANTQMNVGLILEDLNNLPEAQRQVEAAQQLRLEALHREPDNEKIQRDLAKGYYSLGNLQWKEGSIDDAQQSFTAAVAQLEKLLKRFPNDLDNQKLLALCYRLLGDLNTTPEQSRLWYAKAMEQLRALAGQNPDVSEYKVELASLLVNIGYFEYDSGNVQRARESWNMALGILEPLAQQNPRMFRVRYDLGSTLRALGELFIEQQQPKDAQTFLERAIQVFEALAAESPQDERVREQLKLSRESLGTLAPRNGTSQ